VKDLEIPIKETGIDSIDLVTIRVGLEKYFNFEVNDADWYGFNSLTEVLYFFHKNKRNSESVIDISKPIMTERTLEIRMPQMANSALSENWFLKEIGDIHWELLSLGLVQKSSKFKDDVGNRLYATFVRINYSIRPLNYFQENEIIELSGEISRFGSNTYFTSIHGNCNDKSIHAELISIFAIRELNYNSMISKSNPQTKINHIKQLDFCPDILNQYKLLKKELLDELSFQNYKFQLSNNSIYSIDYKINPYYEINGVGLLYFACYPIILTVVLTLFFVLQLN